MAVRIRLRRVGSKKNPIWRIVVADKRSPRDGRTIETIGQYNPQTNPSLIEFDAASLVLRTYNRMNSGTVRGDQELAERYLNLFFSI